jgi:3'-5' exoribonuclease
LAQVATGKKTYLKDLTAGQTFNLPLMVQNCQRRAKKNGSAYLSLDLADRTKVLGAKLWDHIDQFAPFLVEGQVALVQGDVSSYQGTLQLTIRGVKPVDPESLDLADFFRTAKRPIPEMTEELFELVAKIQDPHYRLLAEKALTHPKTSGFFTAPAAKSFHHAYVGGLLEHTLSVTKLAFFVAGHYGPSLNGDLLAVGALLHDVGKCWELTQSSLRDYTTVGRLLGHLFLGAEFVAEVAKDVTDFPADKLLLVRHLLLSHHGLPQYGAVQTPKFLEAIVLHQLDDLDGKLNGVGAFIRENLSYDPTGRAQWTSYNSLLTDYFYAPPGSIRWGEDPKDDQNPLSEPAERPAASSQATSQAPDQGHGQNPPDFSQMASAEPDFNQIYLAEPDFNQVAMAEPDFNKIYLAEPDLSHFDPLAGVLTFNNGEFTYDSVSSSEKSSAELGPKPLVNSQDQAPSPPLTFLDPQAFLGPQGPPPAPVNQRAVSPAVAPEDPIPLNPAPLNPAPLNPAPLNPAPLNPAPLNPAPLNPAPLNPSPLNPAPLNPAPLNPAPLNPAPINSAPINSAPINSAPLNPAPVNSAPLNPTPPNPTLPNPTLIEPKSSEKRRVAVKPKEVWPEEEGLF